MAKELYIFSGLGADERIFMRLDFSNFKTTFIKWIKPIQNEPIEEYATRLLAQISSKRPILVGVSFGGIMAVEVAKLINPENLILISSVKTKYEIPFYFRFAGFLNLQKVLPLKLLKSSNFITYWFFGVSSKFEKQLLKQILVDTDSTFLTWAIGQLIHWKNQNVPKKFIHIHGTSDRILPLKFVDFDKKVKNGGHLMTISKSIEMNKYLKEILE